MSTLPAITDDATGASQFLQATFNALTTHIAILDEQGTIIKVNTGWSRFAIKNNFKGNQFGLGQNYLKICDAAAHSKEATAVAGNIRAILNGHSGEFTLEYPCHAPREQRWFLVRITRFDGEGPLRVVVAHENITARKRAEHALQAGERRLRLALQAGGLGAFEHIVKQHISVVSPEFCHIFGRPVGPTFSQDEWAERLHPEDRSWVLEQVGEMIQQARPMDLEYRLCLPGGEVRWIRAMAHPIDLDGTVEHVHGVVQDITKRKHAEAELRQFSFVAEQSPVSIVITDLQGSIEYVNPKFCAVTGYSVEDVRGKNPRLLKSGNMSDESYRKMWLAITAGHEWHGEFHNRKKNGELYWESASISPLRDEKGRVNRFIAVKEDITARRQAAHDLAESKQFLDQIINSVGEPIFVKDRQHRYVLLNNAYSLWLGHSIPEIIGKTRRDFFPNEKAELFWERDEKIFTTGQESVYEEIITDASGHVRHVLSCKNRFINEQGDLFLVGALHDITQSKKLEAALRESAHRQKAILDNIPDPAWLRDRAGNFLMVNRAWSNFAGINGADAVGRKIEEIGIFPPEIARRSNEEDEMVMSSRQLSQRDLKLEFAGSDSLWFEVIKTALVDEKGQAFGVAGIARDITERRRTAEMQKEQIVLREQLAKVAANAPGIIYSYRLRPDGSACFPYVSPALEDFCGVPAAAALRDATPVFDLVPADDRARLRASRAVSAANMSPWREEFRLQHPRKGLLWVEGQSTPEPESDGGILWHGFLSDITARKRSAEELAVHKENEERARQELERQHALSLIKSRFVSLVSHEFRTPLCAINMAAFMLTDYAEGMSPEERSEHARNIQQSVGRMTAMMEDFLTHDKVQTGKMECRPAWLDVAAFCRELIPEVVTPLAPGRHVECTIEPAVRGAFLDQKILRHILVNLLSNAVKYSPPDQPVFIDIERTSLGRQDTGEPANPGGDFVQLKVRDSGIGIPAADLPRLFETFHRAGNVGNRPGTGMGLAIVKQFVDLHGGTIRVASQEGKGTTFWVWLPLTPADAPQKAAPARTPPEKSPNG